VAAEADEKARTAFREEIASWPRERFVFIDETGINTDMSRRYAWAPRGERIQEKLPRNTPKTTTVVGALGAEGLRANWELEGALHKSDFLLFLESCLGPVLQKGDIVFLDRLSAHRGADVAQAVEARGARLVYLPAYSPDFNPIEQCWSKMKAALRAAAARSRRALHTALEKALQTITVKDAQGWFAHAGYVLP
jgi:transposase